MYGYEEATVCSPRIVQPPTDLYMQSAVVVPMPVVFQKTGGSVPTYGSQCSVKILC